jgi:hypothetical protein
MRITSRTVSPAGLRSRYRSELSVSPAVTPQQANPLCPTANAGVPIIVAPATDHSGVVTCARYQIGGAVTGRCGSFAKSGLPDAVRLPAMAQLFDPPPGGA